MNGESSEIYVGITSEVVRKETILESSYPSIRPTKLKRTRAESISSTANETLRSRTGGTKKDSSEDVIVSDKNIKIVFQLPINNKRTLR